MLPPELTSTILCHLVLTWCCISWNGDHRFLASHCITRNHETSWDIMSSCRPWFLIQVCQRCIGAIPGFEEGECVQSPRHFSHLRHLMFLLRKVRTQKLCTVQFQLELEDSIWSSITDQKRLDWISNTCFFCLLYFIPCSFLFSGFKRKQREEAHRIPPHAMRRKMLRPSGTSPSVLIESNWRRPHCYRCRRRKQTQNTIRPVRICSINETRWKD